MAVPFRLPESIVTLVIDDGPYAGVEAEARMATSWASLMAVQRWLSAFASLTRDDEDLDLDDADRMLNDAADIFSGQIVSWNIADFAPGG